MKEEENNKRKMMNFECLRTSTVGMLLIAIGKIPKFISKSITTMWITSERSKTDEINIFGKRFEYAKN